MPEGDTIRKIAATLHARMHDQVLTHARLRDRPDLSLSGRRVSLVRAHGKHLFVELDDGLIVRSHLGMHGSWHRYARGESWRRPRRQAALELGVGDDVFVCFNAKEVEALRAGSIRTRQYAARLGPDLTVEPVAFDRVMERAGELFGSDVPAMDMLLDQRPASGIGNVYKCEVLFLHGIHPQAPRREVGDSVLLAMYETAHQLLRKNLQGGPRVTRFEQDGRGDHWVYGRLDQPCFECDTRIVYARMGRGWRSTYWCPRCQKQASP